MKKILLGALTILSVNLSFGQSFTTSSGDTAYAQYQNPGPEVSVYNTITNNTSSGIFIKWRVQSTAGVGNGWKFTGFCDNNMCYTDPATGDVQVSFAYLPGVPGDFHAVFEGDNAVNNSSAWVQILATDTAANYAKMLTFIAQKGTNNVVNVSKSDEDVVLYPNPARSHVNLVFNSALGVKNVAIYNMIGKLVSVYKVTGNSARIELDDVPSGIYFVRLVNAQGRIVATRKFTHQ